MTALPPPLAPLPPDLPDDFDDPLIEVAHDLLLAREIAADPMTYTEAARRDALRTLRIWGDDSDQPGIAALSLSLHSRPDQQVAGVQVALAIGWSLSTVLIVLMVAFGWRAVAVVWGVTVALIIGAICVALWGARR